VGVKIITGGESIVAEGATWALVFELRDASDCVVYPAEAPTVTVQPPAGSPVAATLTELAGRWLAEYPTAAPGRHVATIVHADYGTGYAVAAVREVVDALPDLDEVKDYLGPNSATDAQVQDALDAETDAQASACRMPAVYPKDLRQALKRRVARNLAMRGIPLAVLQGDAEGGDATVLPGNDPEVRRFEKPWRRLTMG
jgi:hypothetical protein